MKKYCILLFIIVSQLPVVMQADTAHSLDLKATPPAGLADIDTYKQQRVAQNNYFFEHLPKTTQLPDSITTEVKRVFTPLLPLLSPQYKDQTEQERQTQVLNNIISFYGLLYVVAQEQAATTTTPNPTLTPLQLKQSKIWQDHLKIMAATSYNQEIALLKTVHENELELFPLLPQFEVAYYQPTFAQIRKSSELTRIYLILIDRLRNRFLDGITRSSGTTADPFSSILQMIDTTTASLKTASISQKDSLQATLMQQKNQLFQLIETFKAGSFYTLTVLFENLDWSKTYPVSFKDQHGNAVTFKQIIQGPYNFDQYFLYDKKTGIATVNSVFSLMFETGPVAQGSTEQGLFFTPLGNALFSGMISYQTTTLPDGTSLYTGTFEYQKTTGNTAQITIDQFFTEQTSTITLNKQPIEQTSLVPTMTYMELLCFTAMKMLYTDIAEIFIGSNLPLACKAMTTTDLPNFIAQQPEDYLLLSHINRLQDFFTNQGLTDNSGQTPSVQSCKSFGRWLKKVADTVINGIKKAATEVWHGIETAAKGAFAAVKDVGNAIWHGMKAIGDEVVALYYASAIAPMLFQGISASDALKHAASYQKAANAQMNAATSDLMKSVGHIAQAAEGLAHAAGAIAINAMSEGLSLIDSKIGTDMLNTWDAVANGIINFAKDSTDMFISQTSSIVKLSAGAIELVSSTIASIETGSFSTLKGEIKDLAKNTASAILSYISLAVSQITDALKSAMTAIGYFVQTLTDTVVQLSAAVATLAYYGWADGFSTGFNELQAKVSEHQRIISSIITTVVLIAVTVATGGAATPFAAGMLAMNIGMMAMSIVGAGQADQLAIDKKAKQHKFVEDYKQYVIENASVIQGFNTQKAIEELVQLQNETMNQERGLLYYQNYVNAIFNGTVSAKAYGVGNIISHQTGVSDSTGVMVADLGSLYAIQTGRMSLTPTGGFAIYNKSRNSFSQEAALEPIIMNHQTQVTTNLTQTADDNGAWFHQKDLALIPSGDGLKADIVWRSLYEYDGPFYIGIYLTERFIDTQAVNNAYNNLAQVITPTSGTTTAAAFDAAWQKVETFGRYLVDYDHLAKMFVCYRQSAASIDNAANSIPKLGIYQHEATEQTVAANNGWIQSNIGAINFKRGTWYRMQATIVGTKLTVNFWELADEQAARNATTKDPVPNSALTQTTTIEQALVPQDVLALSASKYFGGSMGVITSGAAVEYIVIEPTRVLTVNLQGTTSQLTTLTKPIESAARVTANTKLSQIPGMNQTETERSLNWQKELASQMGLTFGNLTLTALDQESLIRSEFIYQTKGIFDQTTPDFVVFAKTNQNPNAQQVGISALETPKPLYIISLVTNQIIDTTGKIVGQVESALNLYLQQHPKLSDSVMTQLQNSQRTYFQSMSLPLTFANSTLTADVTQMANGLYVYSAPALDPRIQGKTDYFVTTTSNSVGITGTGAPLKLSDAPTTTTGLVSLVTGQVYTLQQNGKTASILSTKTVGTTTITDAKTTYAVYPDYQAKLTPQAKATIEAVQQIFNDLQKTVAAEQALQTKAQNTLNTLNTQLTSVITTITFATGDALTALKSAQVVSQKALTDLNNALAAFNKALPTNQAGPNTQVAINLNNVLDQANSAITACQNAITTYNNTPVTQTSTDYGSSSDSGYGYGTTDQSYNANYGTDQATDYGYGSGY